MATLTNEQIEQKKQQLKDELVEAGAWPLDEDDLDQAAGAGMPVYFQLPPTKQHGVV